MTFAFRSPKGRVEGTSCPEFQNVSLASAHLRKASCSGEMLRQVSARGGHPHKRRASWSIASGFFRVFERRHRTDEYDGTGIGLAIVFKGMERMRGLAGVEPRPVKAAGSGSNCRLMRTRNDLRHPFNDERICASSQSSHLLRIF